MSKHRLEKKLLPCPFCGEEKIYFNEPYEAENFKGSVNCPSCLASMPREVNDDQELIDAWNQRASSTEARNRAIEEAAKVAESFPELVAGKIAKSIRALATRG